MENHNDSNLNRDFSVCKGQAYVSDVELITFYTAYHFSNHDDLWTKTLKHKEELCESCIADT